MQAIPLCDQLLLARAWGALIAVLFCGLVDAAVIHCYLLLLIFIPLRSCVPLSDASYRQPGSLATRPFCNLPERTVQSSCN